MGFTGKPSAGCDNCRASKKRCDQALPKCACCTRLKKVCGGYRDAGDLMFKDQSALFYCRVGPTVHPDPPVAKKFSPIDADAARAFFLEQFVTDSHLTFFRDTTLEECAQKSLLACVSAVMANRLQDTAHREAARLQYVEALTATHAILDDPKTAKKDSALISILLLGIFERLTWEGSSPIHSGTLHIMGAAQVLQLRGIAQTQTRTGLALFREVCGHVVFNVLSNETEVPDFLLEWTLGLKEDREFVPADQLVPLAARLAAIRKAFAIGDGHDDDIAKSAAELETDLLAWAQRTLAAGTTCSFYNIHDRDTAHHWDGTRHEEGIPQTHRFWNLWRYMRILLSRVQETIWRRSVSSLDTTTLPLHDADYYQNIRSRMASDICIATAYAFGNDETAEPPVGAVSSGYLLVLPLTIAGSCLLEQLAEIQISPSGRRSILLDRPYHLDTSNPVSQQLAWLIKRLDYIADKVGIRCAAAISQRLRGESRVHFDLSRSIMIMNAD